MTEESVYPGVGKHLAGLRSLVFHQYSLRFPALCPPACVRLRRFTGNNGASTHVPRPYPPPHPVPEEPTRTLNALLAPLHPGPPSTELYMPPQMPTQTFKTVRGPSSQISTQTLRFPGYIYPHKQNIIST